MIAAGAAASTSSEPPRGGSPPGFFFEEEEAAAAPQPLTQTQVLPLHPQPSAVATAIPMDPAAAVAAAAQRPPIVLGAGNLAPLDPVDKDTRPCSTLGVRRHCCRHMAANALPPCGGKIPCAAMWRQSLWAWLPCVQTGARVFYCTDQPDRTNRLDRAGCTVSFAGVDMPGHDIDAKWRRAASRMQDHLKETGCRDDR